MNLTSAPNVRFAEVNFGDDLKRIALREMGDASKWVTLVLLNELRPPYIADQPSLGVLAYGDMIKVPSAGSSIDASTDPDHVYGSDLLVSNRRLSVVDGDLALVAGVPNLVQALRHHIVVDKRELGFHPEFGCHVRSVIGVMNGPTAAQLAAFYVKSAILEDSRIESVSSCTAEVLGDQVRVTANVKPISGRPVDLVLVV